MDLEELQALVVAGESSTLEFKKSTAKLKSAAESLCGFLNASGGIVLIGVADDGTIVGQEVSDKTKREISRVLEKFSPMPTIDIRYVVLEGRNKAVIVLNAITDVTKQPYFFDNQAYIRSESTTLPMPRDHLQHMLITNAQHNDSWEKGITEGVSIDDLDHDEILRTVREGVTNLRIPEEAMSYSVEQVLRRFKLLDADRLRNAAVVLFAKQPDEWFPQCLLKLARFKGTNRNEIMDSRQVHGHAFHLLNEALLFAQRHLPVASIFPNDRLERQDKPLFPVKALREIFANAIAHRDYSLAGGSINFAIYDDRIEIWNNGSLMPGLQYSELQFLHESVLRNPIIASILYYRKLSESWGRGIELIVQKCSEEGLPEPKFFERSGGFCVCLRSGKDFQETRGMVALSPLSTRQEKILQAFEDSDEMTLSELTAFLGGSLSERTMRRDLSGLQKLGLIQLEGFGRGARWRLLEKRTKEDKRGQKGTKEDT